VEATGAYDDKYFVARNFSQVQLEWLTCCPPEISAFKAARVDSADPKTVWYRIDLRNRARYTMVAFVIDSLPDGMTFVNASLEPSEVKGGRVTWTILDLEPGETERIDYRAAADGSGTYVNTAHIEAYSIDGPDSAAADVTSRVYVGMAAAPGAQASGWSPPACFGLNCTGTYADSDWVPCYTCGAPEPATAMSSAECSNCGLVQGEA